MKPENVARVYIYIYISNFIKENKGRNTFNNDMQITD